MGSLLRICCLCLVLASIPVAAGESVIVNVVGTAPELSEADLRAIFNGHRTLWPNRSPIIVVVAKTDPGNAALMTFLGKTNGQFISTWKRLMFSGNGVMPRMLQDDAEVAAFVARTPHAIGLITGLPPTGVTVIPIEAKR